jgi:hypothetical protein
VSPDLDPIDLLVPRPRPLGRSLVLSGLLVVVVIVVVLCATTGLIRPRLGLEFNDSYTAASTTSRPSLGFNVRNNGSFPLTIVSVDARQPGLVDPRIAISHTNVSGESRFIGSANVRVPRGSEVHIELTFAAWDCGRLISRGSETVPIHISGPLGLQTTQSLVPGLHFDPPSTSVSMFNDRPDPNEIGWAAGITWTACHRGSSAPNSATP